MKKNSLLFSSKPSKYCILPLESEKQQGMNNKKTILLFLMLIQSLIIIAQDVVPKTIIIKLKDPNKSISSNEKLSEILTKIDIKSTKQLFPGAKFDKNAERQIDIRNIYEIQYDANIEAIKATKLFKKLDNIEYAEPKYIQHLFYEPDDPLNTNKYCLTNIKAYEAWDIWQGDTNTVIGITDTGTDIDHEDLMDNVAYNYGDPFPYDNEDNDNDGFIDNFIGWDLGEDDNIPQWESNEHGVYVSGLAAATTDNGIGVSGSGFKCRFLPVKISNSQGILTHSYEGVIYAADHGCKIINCSWGSNIYSDYGKDIIDYVTINRGCLVIASAGNDNDDALFYPASYEGVLSIGGTDINDFKWAENAGKGSNYGFKIDVCAPSFQNFSTVNNGYMTGGGGTSFSAPITAGATALVYSYFDTLSPLQAAEQIRVTCDVIDTIAENQAYAGLLGKGRINMYRALTETDHISIRFENVLLTDYEDDKFYPGDTVYISGNFVNYLIPANNVLVSLSCNNPNVEIIDNQLSIPSIQTMEKIHYNDIFSVRIKNTIGIDEKIGIKLNYIATDYNDFEYVVIEANNSIVDVSYNDITSSITSKGRFGFLDFDQTKGIGLSYKLSDNLLFDGGLIIGNTNSNISDCFRRDQHFTPLTVPSIDSSTTEADYIVKSSFVEYNFNFTILQETMIFSDSMNSNYLMVKYQMINNGQSSAENFYAGLLYDWDIINPMENHTFFDTALITSYSYDSEHAYSAGLQLLSETNYNHYAFDNEEGGGDGIDISNGFYPYHASLAFTNTRNEAGTSGSGTDIVDLLVSGPHTVAVNDTLELYFAILVADNLVELEETARKAKDKYQALMHPDVIFEKKDHALQVSPNPANEILQINFGNKTSSSVELRNIQGQLVYQTTASNKKELSISTKNLIEGIYILNVVNGNTRISRKIVIAH